MLSVIKQEEAFVFMKEMTIGERIQQLRKAAGLSQEQLAEKLDVSRQSVSKWELNDAVPELTKVIALSELFEISTDELLKGRINHGAADKETPIETIARLNSAQRRIRTGFVTAMLSAGLLAVELMLLPVIQMAESRAFGHYKTNAMDYAADMPMSLVIKITVAVIIAGGVFMAMGCKDKKSKK